MNLAYPVWIMPEDYDPEGIVQVKGKPSTVHGDKFLLNGSAGLVPGERVYLTYEEALAACRDMALEAACKAQTLMVRARPDLRDAEMTRLLATIRPIVGATLKPALHSHERRERRRQLHAIH